jgi:hypothetical protein
MLDRLEWQLRELRVSAEKAAAFHTAMAGELAMPVRGE